MNVPSLVLSIGQCCRNGHSEHAAAGIVAASAQPNAGAAAAQHAAVGSLGTKYITRGIGVPYIKDLKGSTTRSGGMTGEDWRRYWTAEAGGRGGIVVKPPVAKPPRPQIAATKQAKPKAPPKPKVRPAPQPTARPGPSGPPVRDGLDVQATGKVGKAAQHALDQIAKVHGDGKLPKIPLKGSRTKNVNGMYRTGPNGKPLEIEVSDQGERPALTAIHEIGHFLDYGGIPWTHILAGVRDFAKDPRFAGWVKAVSASQEIKSLKALSQGSQKTPSFPLAGGAAATVTFDRTHAAYLLRWREIWARSYAQYITVRSGDSELRTQLDKRRDPLSWYQQTYNSQWTDSSFEPIAAAMDDVFKGLGWIK